MGRQEVCASLKEASFDKQNYLNKDHSCGVGPPPLPPDLPKP